MQGMLIPNIFFIADQAFTPSLPTGDPQVLYQLTTPKEREKDPKNTGIVGMIEKSHVFNIDSKTEIELLSAKLTCEMISFNSNTYFAKHKRYLKKVNSIFLILFSL